MAKLKHGAHECVLTSPEIVNDGICNICFKDKPVDFACDLCNFDICRPCSKLPLKMSHSVHIEHTLEFCVGKHDVETSQKTTHMLCSACGVLFSGSFYYKCKECEIYLDLGCATLRDIITSWDAQETLHYSHTHLVRRCKPGPDARGSCLMCEYPITPSAICYGCVQCYTFIHERCLNLPREIKHPLHPAHPLTRLDFTHTCGPGKNCDACGLHIDGAPLGCPQCNFSLHVRCADSLLRGLMHKAHEHRLFYVVPDRDNVKLRFERCSVCFDAVYGRPYYHCADSGCGKKFHLKCLGIPKYVVKKAYHIHPLVGRKYLPEDNSLEYCGVCETIVYAGHHAYCCEECDFVGHIECIINEEAPCPLYLKDLYFCGEEVTRLAHQDKCEIMEIENKPMVIDISHNHVLTFVDTQAYFEHCSICSRYINGTYWECKPRELKSDSSGFSTYNPCVFRAHDNCLKLGQQPSEHRFHLNHLLTFLPSYPAGILMNCDVCKGEISSFNLFCRICNFIICTKCVVKANQSLGELQRGQKFIRYEEGNCLRRRHALAQVMVSMSYTESCTICNDRLCGNAVSCVECKEIYHSRCVELERLKLVNHPLHLDHTLECELKSGSKCIACKQDVTAYAYFCSICSVSFHLKCIEAVGISRKVENHKHYLYHFWSNSARACIVCNRPMRQSFYGCNKCNISAHVQCIGFPDYVKNQRHQHIVRLIYASDEKNCSLCESECSDDDVYACKLCKEYFHKECIMSMAEREAATEEEQINDIYLIYIERDLVKFIYLLKNPEEVFLENTDINEEDSDSSC